MLGTGIDVIYPKENKKLFAEVEKRGGKVLMPPKTISPDTTIAHFQDPEGNVVGLVKAHAI